MIEEPKLMRVARDMRRPSAAQISALKDVPTGYVVDAMQGVGALSPDIKAIGDGRDIDCVACGPALTAGNAPSDIMATLCSLKFIQPGDVVVAAFGGFQGCAAAGDLVTGMMHNSGAAGFVTDGPMRDYDGIVDVGLPCWCTGLNPNSPFTNGPGRVGLPVQIGGRTVETGDMIVADRDGVVVVPFSRIAEVIGALTDVRQAESDMEAEVETGLKIPESIEALLASENTEYV
ncbi:RraA family protein [Litoreibacter roseus]|uniref:Putative 4-hydroxy-4-methyl-2-oxoglutarate aldolase n=1 Tax=Litoreibacter roseus TaxID=2601869 RepID=A0A6N6JBL7_9RHOB|nr:RraA family protein [Litoreibacter roseus]GFE63454.1 methyltransferase [Litoreibacter roseus]